MSKKTITYTWNEDLQRVISGDMPQEIEAYQHDKNEGRKYKFPVDDFSEFLPQGYRRSEKWITAREAHEKAEHLNREKQRQQEAAHRASHREINDDHPNNDNSNDGEVRHNGNTRQVSNLEIWLNGLGGVIVVALMVIVIMLFVAYYVNHADPSSWIYQSI